MKHTGKIALFGHPPRRDGRHPKPVWGETRAMAADYWARAQSNVPHATGHCGGHSWFACCDCSPSQKGKRQRRMGGGRNRVGVACLVPLILSTINPPVRGAPINEITTDTANPPAFLVLDDTREGARTSLVYDGAKVAETQAAAYPVVAALETDLAADAAYGRALDVAQEMGWDVVASDAANRRFEATARTSVFYFADDVVVVVAEQDGGSRVDMRSVSRIGRSDQRVNAARIRDFQQKFGK